MSEEEEIVGLDSMEHGLASAYSGFSIMDVSNTMTMDVNENTDLGYTGICTGFYGKERCSSQGGFHRAKAMQPACTKWLLLQSFPDIDHLKKAMNDLGVTGMTCTQVMGCGIQKGSGERYRGAEVDATLLPKIKVEVVVSKIPVDSVVAAAKKALYTGHIGDGKIFVYDVAKVVKIRTGEEDMEALQDVE